MKQLERRSFLMGANDCINLPIVGLGGRGTDHVKEYLQQPGSRIAGICDIDSARVERMESFILKESGSKPKTYRGMRQVFADKDCNHWRALAAIWACQAGKDVYTEKPASHNIWEGRKMVEAARKYGRMVQVGSQSRSLAHKGEAMDLLHGGIIGKVYLAKGRKSLEMANKPTRAIFDIQRQADIDLPTDGELYRFDVIHADTSWSSIRQRKGSSATRRPTNWYRETTASPTLSPKKFKHGE